MYDQENKKNNKQSKSKVDTQLLLDRVNQLETILVELATHTGYSSVLRKNGLEAYKPTPKDMSRFA